MTLCHCRACNAKNLFSPIQHRKGSTNTGSYAQQWNTLTLKLVGNTVTNISTKGLKCN